MKYLFVDLNISLDGHKLGFMQNTLNYLAEKNDGNHYSFLANYSTKFEINKPKEAPEIEVFYTTEAQETEFSTKKRTLQKAHAQWLVIRTLATEKHIDHVILMDVDLYQLSIGFSKNNFKISGIWFRPYLRLEPENNSFKAKLKTAILKIQKKITIRVALLNKNVSKIFILNDETMPVAMQSISDKFAYLPDPVFSYPQQADFHLRTYYKIPLNNLILLQFGFIDDRKNNENIIRALQLLPKEIAEKTSLLIIGKFGQNYLENINSWYKINPSFQLICRDEFISDQEMESTFAQSDVILRMNMGFSGSSGIVGIAAAHNKPCIVSDFGVMAEQVEKYKLGKIIKPTNQVGISKAILEYHSDFKEISGKHYLETHSVGAFVETLVKR
jgi:glycosyltransferase involved in cell wall biosynthesis